MWIDAFKTLRAKSLTLEGRLLNGSIAFRGSAAGDGNDATARGDAALAVMASRLPPPAELALVHPEATPAKARQAVLALAFEELAKYQSRAYESGPAGLLFITQQIVDARKHFAAVRVGSTPIAEVFRILSLTGAAPARHWKNLLVANPGRALLGGPHLRTLRMVVIDASHPRTLQHLPNLLAQPDLAQVPLRIVVAPPHEALLTKVPGRMVWLWDTPTSAQLHGLLTPTAIPKPAWGSRTYWLAAKPDLDEKFADAEKLLTEATRLGAGGGPPEILEGWAILTALRGLCVPLEQAEHAARNSRHGLRLRDRLGLLKRSQPTAGGELRHFLAMHWAGVLAALDEAYALLASEGVPPKLSSLIDALDEFDGRPDLPLRIVTGGEDEALLLASRLADIDDRLRRAVDEGTMEVVHQREEARRVAEGRVRATILTGARGSRLRYLDLFTTLDVNVVAYPSEAVRDRQRLERYYQRWQPMADGTHQRIVTMLKLGGPAWGSDAAWRPPAVNVHTTAAPLPAAGAAELPEASLDITWVSPEDVPAEERVAMITAGDSAQGGLVVIEDVDGGKLTLRSNMSVDIYRRETEKLLRVSVGSVLAGDYLVLLLDDECESLFERLCEVAQQRRPALNTLHLERWNVAKSRLHRQFGTRQAIYDRLKDRLSVSYAALKDWFGADRDDDGECIGPREEADFLLVALLSGIYRDEADAHTTFRSIHAERVNRRQLGRQMRGAIKNLAKGHTFDLAMRTAEALNSEAEEVMHALELRVVAKVTRVP
ncbi:MAG: hypothetical protein PSU94_08090 [Lacunisphaera sp.]|nr:hypothetical protein [Lacunisphaera sp.]